MLQRAIRLPLLLLPWVAACTGILEVGIEYPSPTESELDVEATVQARVAATGLAAQRTATEAALAPTPSEPISTIAPTPTEPAPTLTPTSARPPHFTPLANWYRFVSEKFAIQLQYPAHWEPEAGEPIRFSGRDGFFELAATNSQDNDLADACQAMAGAGYGSMPSIEWGARAGQEACLIMPAPDQDSDQLGRSALIVRFPQPMRQIVPDVSYAFLILFADRQHVRAISDTLYFLLPDLSVSRMYVEMEGRAAGCVLAYSPYGIRVVIRNTGDVDAGPFVVELNGRQQTIVAGLPRGQSVELHFAGTDPSGRYNALVDATDQISEIIEDNNFQSYQAVTPTPPPLCTATPSPTATLRPSNTPTATRTPSTTPTPVLPDLFVSSKRLLVQVTFLPPCGVEYTPSAIAVEIQNGGAGNAGPFVVELNGKQETVGAGLLGGQSASIRFVPPFPSGADIALVDVHNQISESNEDNNVHAIPVVTPTPWLPCTPTPTPTATIIPSGATPTRVSGIANASTPRAGSENSGLTTASR